MVDIFTAAQAHLTHDFTMATQKLKFDLLYQKYPEDNTDNKKLVVNLANKELEELGDVC